MSTTSDGNNRINILLNRVIMNATTEDVVDHKNHNPLDNRKLNLRICSYKQNNQNKTVENKESCLAGVHFIKEKNYWVAQIKTDNKTIHLIGTPNKELAEIIRLKAEQIVSGEFSPNYELFYLLDDYEEMKEIHTLEELKLHYKPQKSKLSKEEVYDIKTLLMIGELSGVEIARRYNVNKATISDIKLHKTWGNIHIEPDNMSHIIS